MSKMGFIYALIDPRNGAVCYVGQTVCQLKKRLVEHYAAPRTSQMRTWIEELAALGLKPEIKLLEEVPRSRLDEYESYWMGEMAYTGAYLLNSRLSKAAVSAYLGGVKPNRPASSGKGQPYD